MRENLTDILPVMTRYLRGEATELETQLLLQWLEESGENRRFYADFASNYTFHQALTRADAFGRTEEMSARLNARIDAGEELRHRRSRMLRYGGLAAAVALLLGFGVLTGRRSAAQAPVAMEILSNPGPDVRPFRLADGTQVWLLPDATLRYNVAGLPDRREMALEGQAYFDVARDPDRPLTLTTPNIGVQVLGTAFSVSTGAERSQVVLERGSVRILSEQGQPLVTLRPDQKAVYSASAGAVEVETVFAEAYVTQHYNLISMTDVTLSQIIARLQARFGVTLRVRNAPSDRGKRYTVNYLKTDTLEDVLSIVEYLTGARCEQIN